MEMDGRPVLFDRALSPVVIKGGLTLRGREGRVNGTVVGLFFRRPFPLDSRILRAERGLKPNSAVSVATVEGLSQMMILKNSARVPCAREE